MEKYYIFGTEDYVWQYLPNDTWGGYYYIVDGKILKKVLDGTSKPWGKKTLKATLNEAKKVDKKPRVLTKEELFLELI